MPDESSQLGALLVFAHADEAVAFEQSGIPHLVSGVGKVNATFALSRALLSGARRRAGRVVVLGTAGAVSDEVSLDAVYRVTEVIQHDFSLDSPVLELSGTVSGSLADKTAVLATGDTFVQDDEARQRIAGLGATLVDMEGYAFATVCQALGVPLEMYKAPSDFADSGTTQEEWDEIVFAKSTQLLRFLEAQLPELLAPIETSV